MLINKYTSILFNKNRRTNAIYWEFGSKIPEVAIQLLMNSKSL